MQFGERQVETELSKIRRDHTARYEWAAKTLPEKSLVIDFACGVGYGANIMAKAGHKVIAVDKCEEALAYGDEHWSHENVQFATGDAETLTGGSIGEFDAAVCFETVEHISDPTPLLKSLRASAKRLLVSVPNEDVMPWKRPDGAVTAFHYRHYTKQQFLELLNACGWNVVEWYQQKGAESEVEKCNMEHAGMGRTIIAVCEPCEEKKLVPIPDHVVILGLGPSLDQYTDLVKRIGNRKWLADEVWGINMLGDIFNCDYIFHMDDVRIQEIRAKALPESNIAAMLEWMKTSKTPIITSRVHAEYPALVEFPLEDVLNEVKYDYFNSTAAYAVAYAIFLGVKKISCFGMDYTYPNAHDAEKGRACVEFWLGMAAERGIKIVIPQKSSLMDAIYTQQERFYGYDTMKIDAFHDGEKIKIEFTEVKDLPTAEEIEKKYCHKKHPNALVEENKCAS